jgi:hypothetical protein
MTTKNIREIYFKETKRLPDGSFRSLSDNPLPCALDTEVSAYITWLEKKIIGKAGADIHSRIMKAREEAKTKYGQNEPRH